MAERIPSHIIAKKTGALHSRFFYVCRMKLSFADGFDIGNGLRNHRA